MVPLGTVSLTRGSSMGQSKARRGRVCVGAHIRPRSRRVKHVRTAVLTLAVLPSGPSDSARRRDDKWPLTLASDTWPPFGPEEWPTAIVRTHTQLLREESTVMLRETEPTNQLLIFIPRSSVDVSYDRLLAES